MNFTYGMPCALVHKRKLADYEAQIPLRGLHAVREQIHASCKPYYICNSHSCIEAEGQLSTPIASTRLKSSPESVDEKHDKKRKSEDVADAGKKPKHDDAAKDAASKGKGKTKDAASKGKGIGAAAGKGKGIGDAASKG